MDKKLPTYTVLPSTSGVYAISLVDEPAVESNFIALSKQKPINFKIHNEERRIIYGCALRADFPIYRIYGKEEFNLVFDKGTVRRLMTKFMKEHLNSNFTVDHLDFASGLTVVESWLVEDVENDKAKALGLTDFSEGSWMVGVKVDDDEIWTSIKDGRWHGFSVEAFVDMEEVEKQVIENNKINKDTEMNKKTQKVETVLGKIKTILMGALNEEDVEAVVEEVVDQVEGQTETTEEAIDQLETVVEEIENATEETSDTTEETTETEMEEEIPAEDVAEEVVNTVEDANDTEEGTVEDLNAIVEGLKEEIDALKAENEELKKQNQKMSKQPSTKVVKQNKTEKKGGVSGAFSALKAQGFIS